MAMKVIKKGILFNANYADKSMSSALQPTALITGENTARIFCGARDDKGISRIMCVDIIKQEDELSVTSIKKKPVLDVGLPGSFDDNGVVPSAIIKSNGKIYLYYAGYQLTNNVRFLVLGGLATSEDGGETFNRLKNTPILERTSDEFLFRVPHTVFYENGKWRVWYGGGNNFKVSGSRTLPVYDIRYMESEDGIHFPDTGTAVLKNINDEHRVGRPCVIKRDNKYFMFFGASTNEIAYRLAYAISDDGYVWERKFDIGITYSEDEFDSSMSAYPCVINLQNKYFMLYNGNQYGKFGFGYAQLEF